MRFSLILAVGMAGAANAAEADDVRMERAAGGVCAECDFSGKDLRDVGASGVFPRSNFSGARLDRSELSGVFTSARFRGATLADARLLHARFAQADFTGADLTRVVLRYSDCADAQFAGAIGADVDARGGDFTGARFAGARLPRADFSGARLEGAVFAGADLAEARFARADVSGADFTGAENLAPDAFAEACGDGATRVPEGVNRPLACVERPAAPARTGAGPMLVVASGSVTWSRLAPPAGAAGAGFAAVKAGDRSDGMAQVRLALDASLAAILSELDLDKRADVENALAALETAVSADAALAARAAAEHALSVIEAAAADGGEGLQSRLESLRAELAGVAAGPEPVSRDTHVAILEATARVGALQRQSARLDRERRELMRMLARHSGGAGLEAHLERLATIDAERRTFAQGLGEAHRRLATLLEPAPLVGLPASPGAASDLSPPSLVAVAAPVSEGAAGAGVAVTAFTAASSPPPTLVGAATGP